MKAKAVWTICLLIFFLMMLSLTGCENSQIMLNKDESFLLGDFHVDDSKVYFECGLTVENLTGKVLNVKITALSSEDVEGGLLTRAEMAGYEAEMKSDTFKLMPGENYIEVTFIGEFAGREVKNDRLIPDDISFEAGQ